MAYRKPPGIACERLSEAFSEHQFRVATKLPSQHTVVPIINSPPIATAKSCVVEQKYPHFFA